MGILTTIEDARTAQSSSTILLHVLVCLLYNVEYLTSADIFAEIRRPLRLLNSSQLKNMLLQVRLPPIRRRQLTVFT